MYLTMQAKRCGAQTLSAVFSLRTTEVLLKRHAWTQFQEELGQLGAHLTTGKPACKLKD